ncbi:uncharacterized protein LOC131670350 [Phymastichus coffea]|uniref:uncharacterized protein LOC131670350 n=1 Tax=Phymastichus coffea TaxID=108790 RepID=UPI00273CA813|nr:uncharacterized protein LOC131670350 [Phymastichus coffea]
MISKKIALMKIWIYFSTNYFVVIFAWSGEVTLKNLGEKEFMRLKAKATIPYHGACWHHAVKAIKSSCDKLDDNEHSILALHLANCFLEDSGHVTYNCYTKHDNNDRRMCIHEMSDRAFSVYNEFYIYASHMCFFLYHELWQAETQETIKHLYHASSMMKEQLIKSSQMQNIMLESQKEGIKIQNQLLENGKELENIIETSSKSVANMVFSFKESVQDQKELLFQIFGYLRTFQNWIISEVSWFQSIIYYTVSCILSALFSASKKTANARVILFATQSLNVIIERMLVQYYDNIPEHLNNDKINLVASIWLVRKTTLIICICSLLYHYCSHKDELVENYKVLQRIENRLDSIQYITGISKTSAIRYSKRLALKRNKNTSECHENASEIIKSK